MASLARSGTTWNPGVERNTISTARGSVRSTTAITTHVTATATAIRCHTGMISSGYLKHRVDLASLLQTTHTGSLVLRRVIQRQVKSTRSEDSHERLRAVTWNSKTAMTSFSDRHRKRCSNSQTTPHSQVFERRSHFKDILSRDNGGC